MELLEKLLSNKFGYYLHSVDGALIDNNTEQNADDFKNLAGCDLANQPKTKVIHRFYSDQSDWNYDFNPKMPVSYSFQNGLITVTDIYGQERELKFVMNLQLSHQVFENICYR